MPPSASLDLISDALQQVRLGGAVLFRVSLRAPWSFVSGDGVSLPPPSSHVGIFHVLLEGECRVSLAGEVPRILRAGDAVILPHAAPHRLEDPPGSEPLLVSRLLGDVPLAQVHDVDWPGPGRCTRILCGFLGYQRAAFGPLFDALPQLFTVHLGNDGPGRSLNALLAYAEDEVVSRRPGSNELRLRMTELLFVESLRRYMADLADDATGWLAAVRDPLVGRALMKLHESPAHAWTVTTLAKSVASSRSALAERFQALLSEPPIRYLNHWRMLLAARRLRDSRASIETIAEHVGYASPAAFQRAFKKQFGVSAGTWRKRES